MHQEALKDTLGRHWRESTASVAEMWECQDFLRDDGLWKDFDKEDGLAVQDVRCLFEQCNGRSLLLVVAGQLQAGKIRLPGLPKEQFSIQDADGLIHVDPSRHG